MVALKMIGSKLTIDEVWNIALKSFCGTIEEEEGGTKEKFISFQLFLRCLRKSLIHINE